MTRLPTLNARKVIMALKRLEFEEDNQKGSRLYLRHPITKLETCVPMHGGDPGFGHNDVNLIDFVPSKSFNPAMNSLINLSAQQLRRAAGIKDRIDSLRNELDRILGGTAKTPKEKAPRKRRKMSATARAKIGAAQKARWAKAKGNVSKTQPAKAKRKMSAAAKARWAKIKAAKQ